MFYSVLCVPVEKENRGYSFQLMICQGISSNVRYYFMKDISLRSNDRIKIDLKPGHWKFEEAVGEEKLVIDALEDYDKYVNDYLILSLESLGDLPERKSEPRIIYEKQPVIKADETIHIVRKGESLNVIAMRYGVTIGQIANLNHLKNNNIHAGQKLIIHKPYKKRK